MIKLLLRCLALAGAVALPLLLLAPPLASQQTLATTVTSDDESTPPEQGSVNWLRDYDAAISRSASTGKPLFVLFQEVPG
jgi:hypothetical protein